MRAVKGKEKEERDAKEVKKGATKEKRTVRFSEEDNRKKYAEATAAKEKESIISMAHDVIEQANINLGKHDEYTDERVLNKITEDSLERI